MENKTCGKSTFMIELPSGYLLHSHGIDGPNRNRWFTYNLKMVDLSMAM